VSTNELPTTMPSIQRLLQRISSAEKSNQKEIRITIQEGKELVSDLAVITSKLAKTINEIHAKMDKLNVQEAEINVKMDGGGF